MRIGIHLRFDIKKPSVDFGAIVRVYRSVSLKKYPLCFNWSPFVIVAQISIGKLKRDLKYFSVECRKYQQDFKISCTNFKRIKCITNSHCVRLLVLLQRLIFKKLIVQNKLRTTHIVCILEQKIK